MSEDADALDESLCVGSCERCPALVDSRSQIVEGVGPVDADLLVVGEGPGANEDEASEPFVGRSGDVLDEAFRDAGLARGDVRITNCVRCRPPDNRDPRADELANCRGYLEAEIARLDPDLIVTLGKVPSEHLLGRSVGITAESGGSAGRPAGCCCPSTRPRRCTTGASETGSSRRSPVRPT